MQHLYYTFFTFLFILANSLFAAGQSWNFLGGPQGIYPNDIIFLKNGHVLCSTWSGVFISTDLGENWSISESSKNFGGIFSLTERANGEIIAVASYGIAKSYDKGENWTLISDNAYLNYYGAAIKESPVDSLLYYAADTTIYKSIDGGITWKEILTTGGIVDAFTIDQSGWIYIGVRYSGILRSTDNGISFKALNIGYDLSNAIVSNFYPDNHGGLYFYMSQYPDYIAHFSNNGVARFQVGWTDIPLGITDSGDLIYKAGSCFSVYKYSTSESINHSCPGFVKDQFANKVITSGNVWIANFTYLGIHRSDNAGMAWKSINKGLGYKESIAIETTNSGKMIVSAFSGAFWGGLYNSTDDGETWEQKNPPLDPYFMDIDKLNNGNLIAAGSYGIFCADIEGTNWKQTMDVDLSLSLFVSRSGVIYAGTASHGILISGNNGDSWTAPTGLHHSYFNSFGESSTGRIFASANTTEVIDGYYFSDDEGRTWTYVSSAPFLSVSDFINDDGTLIAGTYRGVYTSTDNGSNWERVDNGYYNKFAAAPNGEIIAIAPGMGIVKSGDIGASWELVGDELKGRTIWDICFDNQNRLFAVTDSGILVNYEYVHPFIISPKYGADKQRREVLLEWSKVPSASGYEVLLSEDSLFNSIILVKSTLENSMLVGSLAYGKTYFWKIKALSTKFTDLFSDIGKFSTVLPFSFSQNHPNPFNPGTSIEFYVPYNSKVTLKVYDVLGDLVADLIDKELSEGKYNYFWKASGLSSGIYFLRLEGDDFIQIRKAILLK